MSDFSDQLGSLKSTLDHYTYAQSMNWPWYGSYEAALLDLITAKKWADSAKTNYSQTQIAEYNAVRAQVNSIATLCPPKARSQAEQSIVRTDRIQEIE
jgi:hypothetical protein